MKEPKNHEAYFQRLGKKAYSQFDNTIRRSTRTNDLSEVRTTVGIKTPHFVALYTEIVTFVRSLTSVNWKIKMNDAHQNNAWYLTSITYYSQNA